MAMIFSGVTITTTGTSGLTTEEYSELHELRHEHENKIKDERLRLFKELPSKLRQKIVDKVILNKLIRDMRNVTVEKNERHKELSNRANPAYIIGDHTVSWDASAFRDNINELLKWFTEEELINAHNDACAEEILST